MTWSSLTAATDWRPHEPRSGLCKLNGNGVTGAAAREGGLVRQAGYPVTRVTNALRQDYPASFVMYRAGLRAEALKLARALGVKSISLAAGLKPSELGPAKLVIVTGRG